MAKLLAPPSGLSGLILLVLFILCFPKRFKKYRPLMIGALVGFWGSFSLLELIRPYRVFRYGLEHDINIVAYINWISAIVFALVFYLIATYRKMHPKVPKAKYNSNGMRIG
ncbi:MAG: hypothetical protein LBM06_06300 [Prevotellaceae bacterium]|jgi:hypothetical protein|nr:hypothetical protein [Prevotellaceae bacterium]